MHGKRYHATSVISQIDGNGVLTRHREALVSGSDDPPWGDVAVDRSSLTSLPADALAGFVRNCHGIDLDSHALMQQVMTALPLLNALLSAQNPHTPHGEISCQCYPDGVHISLDHLHVDTTNQRPHPASPAGLQLPPDFPARLHLTGSVVAYLLPGTPFPSLTIGIDMDATSAHAILAALAQALGTTPAIRGDVHGMLGPLQICGDYQSGSLIISSDAAGAEGFLHHTSGFAHNPEVTQALAEVPRSAYAVLIIRPELWRDLAALLAGLAVLDPQERAQDRRLLLALPNEIATACAGTHEVMFAVADGTSRTTTSHGPILGVLGILIDLGTGRLAMGSLAQ